MPVALSVSLSRRICIFTWISLSLFRPWNLVSRVFFFGQSVLEIERGENCLRPLLTHKTRSDYVMFRNWSRCHGARFLCFCFGLCHNHALYDFLPPEKTKKMPISVFGPVTEFPSVVLCKEPCAALLWGHENFWEMFPLRFENNKRLHELFPANDN